VLQERTWQRHRTGSFNPPDYFSITHTAHFT
jgi:hypothetical protein